MFTSSTVRKSGKALTMSLEGVGEYTLSLAFGGRGREGTLSSDSITTLSNRAASLMGSAIFF